MNQPDIRMILCDVDGTLLGKGEQVISKDVFSAIQKAADKNIQFVIASGRCYPDLQKLFAPVLKSVYIVASDGALAVKNDGVLYSKVIVKQDAEKFISVAQSAGSTSSVLYSKDYIYCIGQKPDDACYQSISKVGDACGNIYKVAFYGLSPFAKCKVENFAKMSGRFSKVYEDALWTEFIATGTDKGVACEALQMQSGISPLETAAFGDNTNDFSMLRKARLTFASPAAIPDIIRMCKFRTDNVSNEIIKLTQERGTL